MKGIITPFKVGIVMIAAFAAFAYMFGSISDDVLSGSEGYTVQAHIEDATGLVAQTRVMIAGIAVGYIEDIELDEGRALITLRINDGVVLRAGAEQTLPDGTVHTINGATLEKKQASLLGDYYIELTPGVAGDPLGDGDYVPTVIAPIGPDTLFAQMAGIAENIEVITDDVQKVTGTFAAVFGDDEAANQLDQIVADLQSMVAELNGIATDNRDGLNNIVRNVEYITDDVAGFVDGAGNNIDEILADISAMTTELRFIIGQSSGDVAEGIGTLQTTLASLQLALDNLNYSLENVQEITDRVVEGEGTIGRLVNDPAISDQTEMLLANANEIVGGVSRLQTWVELRSEIAPGGEAFKNYLSISLRPNIDKFYIFELVDDPRGSTEVLRTTTTTSDPDRPPTIYEEQTRTTDGFKVTLLFGRRWSVIGDRQLLLGGRFGIIESSGGLGFDMWALNESLQLRADVFDFGIAERVRMRTFAMLELGAFTPRRDWLNNLFIQGGVDDALNPGRRSFFFGGGLRFNDEDLKGLLIAAPAPQF